jgi:hypothetical protein
MAFYETIKMLREKSTAERKWNYE